MIDNEAQDAAIYRLRCLSEKFLQTVRQDESDVQRYRKMTDNMDSLHQEMLLHLIGDIPEKLLSEQAKLALKDFDEVIKRQIEQYRRTRPEQVRILAQ